ncbi:hypothetical protein [Methanothermobacter sp.]|uniref:hypothetical protein n=1 Tax=Methanothermobacter sp. TaxID=1884223 RepID=UPI0026205DDB|nr:hypothetical protein [Methanothermobacter sp.]MDI9617547.1 hypothetical protein [Methanothermobacter sp.]
MIIIILKGAALLFITLAAVVSVRNYMLTRFASGVWGFVSMGFVSGAIIIGVRFIKEFIPLMEFEVVKICLLPVMMAFILAASFELNRDILKPI